MTELAAWYQKKIGTYDKQEWETTVEQRVVDGLRHVPLKSTKLRPELIDVDLIRGSSFPKAKPVQNFATIVRLALARIILFPFWKKWWTDHTSPPATRLFFLLWIVQLINITLYVLASPSTNLDSFCIIVPIFLMGGLGIVHAFIVSTAHPHHNGLRCRSLNHDRRRHCILSNTKPEGDIYRSTNISSGDIFNSSSDMSQSSIRYVRGVNKSTQTLLSPKTKSEIGANKWTGLKIPKVSLTPPAHQTVKFNLSPKQRETSGDDEDSPVLHPKCQNIIGRNARVNAEGDDGFESLNGNNSNGSENGDDASNFINSNENHEPDKLADDHVTLKKETFCNENPDEIMFKNKLTRRIQKLSEKKKYWENETKNSLESDAENSENTIKLENRSHVCSDGGSSTNLSVDRGQCESDERFNLNWFKFIDKNNSRTEGRPRRKKHGSRILSSSDEECDTASASLGVSSQHVDFAQTTNSEDCSYCSEPDESESEGLEGDSAWEPFAILNPGSDRISCTIWENGRLLKAQMSVMDISHTIVKRADDVLNRNDGKMWTGTLLAALLAAIIPVTKLLQILVEIGNDQVTMWDLPIIFLSNSPLQLFCQALGATNWERIVNVLSTLLRLGLGTLVFFLLAVARRAFNQRFLYAKLFSHLTSARRARQSSLPHFRLNRVRNIKTWLSVRSYLMRRGPQRSVDIIVSAAFILLVLLISILVIDLSQDQNQGDLSHTAETLGWTFAIGAVLLRLVALGTRASRKHRCLPVLLTEQINLHLAMERRPASKDRLSVANNVLKLAADLLKELESPFKISGLSTNPYLYTITKVVVLSALSGVLSDLLGFKLKLHKIKIK